MNLFKLRSVRGLGGLLAGLGVLVTTLAVLAGRARPARWRPALAPAGNVQAQSPAVG